ncbi:MAG: TonB family protein [Gammaproteobacteria bacterium]|jgi:protein TonB|nr:TonB family protein [Gammaproteobacteria bacterium]
MSAQLYTLSPPVTPGPRAWPNRVAPPLEGRRGAVVAAPLALTTGGGEGPEEGVGRLPADRRRMAAALLLALALNASVLLLPAARGPGEEGAGPPPPISVLLAAPAAAQGQGMAESLQGAPADEPPAAADATPTPASDVASLPDTRALDVAAEPDLAAIPPEQAAVRPATEVAQPEPAPAEPVPVAPPVPPAPRAAPSRAERPKPARTHAAVPPGRSARKPATAEPPGIAVANPGVSAAPPSAAGEGTVAGAGVPSPALDTEAVPIRRVSPVYPLAARTSRTEGRVLVEFTILTDGTVADPSVVEAYPAGVFDREVLQAIRQWRFAPQVEGGQPVSRRARQTVRFSLSS